MKSFYTCIALFAALAAFSQQDPEYTHYMYNMNVVNPAYATGTTNILNLGGLYRSQWVGAVGAPKTMTFFAHMPVDRQVELGLSAISDDIGDGAKKETNLYADFAYVLQFRGQHRLSLGLKAGLTSLQTNFNGFVFESGDPASDAAFAENVNMSKLGVGAGLYYFTDRYYVGLSVPNFLSSRHIVERNGIQSYGGEKMHTFFTGGYVWPVSPNLKLKPAFMTRFAEGTPAAVDVTLNALWRDRFELGAAYRIDDSFSGLMAWQVSPQVRIGYAYDHTLSNLGQFNSGTHEVFLLFDLNFMGRGYDKSPRFF
ncbi:MULTISPECIES: type IX secretion system membrane protein PorP/SprF [unclassified Flavobacterium]|uniref:PorP/SprF family type IX secretion system membrane protein n=1 Tax=unclassified Flavobacterium TaxID=196869 RepID=UPI001F1491D5|nr:MULTISPECIES: type IX secretion system membrane protein PorP/SprF [unclassified Flavobacterium]UMY65930.1 type IX secretion system membrane protein PorP/SprF [Flavobacterium sp. HJ-32-4]